VNLLEYGYYAGANLLTCILCYRAASWPRLRWPCVMLFVSSGLVAVFKLESMFFISYPTLKNLPEADLDALHTFNRGIMVLWQTLELIGVAWLLILAIFRRADIVPRNT
jgi:hypothetical protein